MALAVDSMPGFDLTLIPFLWEDEPDSSVLELTGAMEEEEEEHEKLHPHLRPAADRRADGFPTRPRRDVEQQRVRYLPRGPGNAGA